MRFNGRYILFAPSDKFYINLMLPNGEKEKYVSTLPSSSVHNLVIGKIYVEVEGITKTTNVNTQEECTMEWKSRGWTAKNAN